jgi:hypothetical protein
MATENEVSGILTKLAALYPRYELKPETIRAYAETLSDIPPADLRSGAIECAKTSQWFPSTYELRKATRDALEKQDGERTEAWHAGRNEVMRSRRWVPIGLGGYASPDYKHQDEWTVFDNCPTCGVNYSVEWGECPVCTLPLGLVEVEK